MSIRSLFAACAVALTVLVGLPSADARADDSASSYDVAGEVAADGALTLNETLTFNGQAPAQITQRLATRENLLGDREYVYTISDVKATSGGRDLAPSVDTSSDATTVTVKTEGTDQPVVISYKVIGAASGEGDYTVLRWRVLQGLSVGVDKVHAEIRVPTVTRDIKCTAGAPNSTQSCQFAAGASEVSPMPVFENGALGAGQVLGISLFFDKAAVQANDTINQKWTLGRAFSVAPLPLLVALLPLLLGGLGLYLLHRRNGRDAHAGGEATPIAEFRPTSEGHSEFHVLNRIRPGQVGTVADERVDAIDVTASLLDLAVRGHLLITELPRTSPHAPTDWKLTRMPGDDQDLAPFEARLLDAVAPVGAEGTLVSRISGPVGENIGEVQDALYDEMVSNGWYERRPDNTRNTWNTAAMIFLVLAIVATGALVAFTSFGLLGLVLIALALGLAFVAQEMPARTAKGSALLAGLQALSGQLQTQPTDQMPPHRELQELSEVLPYAIVLGGRDRWLDAIVAADDDEDADSTDLSWYHAPDTWHLRDLPDSLRNFVTTVSGNLFSR